MSGLPAVIFPRHPVWAGRNWRFLDTLSKNGLYAISSDSKSLMWRYPLIFLRS
jgi:hypothetical protein